MKRLFTLGLSLLILFVLPAVFAADDLAALRARAEKGEAEAQDKLGVAYATGEGVGFDPAEAVKWYRKAAEQGLASAQLRLGVVYAIGAGVNKDPFEAVKWYRRAAEQGIADAQFSLGYKYAGGAGVTKDAIEAVKWYRKAAEQGHALAQFNLGSYYSTGAAGVTKDPVEAVKWYRMAAEKGYDLAQFNLGDMYAKGEGVTKDPVEAVKWFLKSAEQGFASAQYFLGDMYAAGDGVTKNPVEAVRWYRKSAEQGDAGAQHNLGVAYATGEGVTKDPVEAVKWYHKAAEQGIVAAQYNLGLSYGKGWGVLKDEIEALAWFNLCAVAGVDDAVKFRDMFERRLGPQAVLAAQQRSKELLKQIEANRAGRASESAPGTVSLQADALVPRASGSGAIVSPSGYVLTAAHVIAGASKISVVTAQGAKSATVVRVDESNDLAVLRLEAGVYAALPIAPSRQVRLGQAVATVGFPHVGIQGFSPKVTRGEISSFNGAGDDPRNWQISVPVQSGNSGGPLLDENGNLVGVVLSKLGLKAAEVTGDLPQNVSYAVKSAYALPLLEPYLGNDAPEPKHPAQKPGFEDMVANAQQSVVLILVY